MKKNKSKEIERETVCSKLAQSGFT